MISVWAEGDEHVRRTSGSSQTDDLGRVVDDPATSGCSGGLVYVVNDAALPLPNRAAPHHW